MVKNMLVVIALLAVGIALLSVGIWARPDGKFPNVHVGKNPAMRKRGIGCVEAQDAQARAGNRMAISERSSNKQN